MTKHELMNQADMLQGNINRMMVTDDPKELLSMYMWAERRLKTIHKERLKELDKGKETMEKIQKEYEEA